MIIKKADKGGSIVIMDSNYYRDDDLVLEGQFKSNTYQQLGDDCGNETIKRPYNKI